MKEETKAKRQQLSELSRIIKMGIGAGTYESVNEGLVELYRQEGHEEIHSFKKWLTLGFVVKKGQKALLLWGQPLKAGKQETPAEPGTGDDEYKFFPLAYVFSNLQVEKLNQPATAE
jgi:hypothetical protein